MSREEILQVIHLEMREMQEEGFNLAPYRSTLDSNASKSQLIRFYAQLLGAPGDEEFKFWEPNTLKEMRATRPAGPRLTELVIDPDILYDRVYGGWLGRVAGCVLGKPVEPWGLKERIVQYLSLANNYPLTNYIPRLSPFPADFYLNPYADGTFLGEIDGAPRDDDTDYTVLALHILERRGLDFHTSDVATEWLSHLAYSCTYTAERKTYRNLIVGIPPEATATTANPEREFIGARIRADMYGFIAPGKPELAAELAYKDARLSHTKNGVYSAMFMAAMIAWSFVSSDMEEIILIGLSEIPENCRLATAVRDVLDTWKETDEWEIAYEQLNLKYSAYHPVHAINNTVWLVLALLYGQGDFEKTICTAVLCGYDTDCNAANAGAVMGVTYGAQNLPPKWTEPIHDTLYSSLAQWRETRITELARRTARIAQKTLSIPW